MKKSIIILLFSSLFFILSCENTETDELKIDNTELTEKNYSYQNTETKVSWIAYKTTDKKGVMGKFTDIEVTNVVTADKPMDVVRNAEFKIPVIASVTGDREKDRRILKFFFGVLIDENITGKMKTVNEDGTGSISIGFNGVEKELPITYTVENEKITVKGSMDLTLWNAQEGINTLNEECKDLHAGSDGITKLWPDVDIEITTMLKKEPK